MAPPLVSVEVGTYRLRATKPRAFHHKHTLYEADDRVVGLILPPLVRRANLEIVVGAEANGDDLQRWGRAAALRLAAVAWIKRSLDERAETAAGHAPKRGKGDSRKR